MKNHKREWNHKMRRYNIQQADRLVKEDARRKAAAGEVDESIAEEEAEQKVGRVHNRRYTPEQEAAAVEAMRNGAVARRLAREMGIPCEMMYYWKRKHNLARDYSDEEKDRAVKAMLDGRSPHDLEEETGIPYSTLCKWRKDAGYESKRLLGLQRKRDEHKQQELVVMSFCRRKQAPKPPAGKADKLTRFCYLMDVINYNRRKEGLPVIQYGELQQHFERYKQWMPEDWEKWAK